MELLYQHVERNASQWLRILSIHLLFPFTDKSAAAARLSVVCLSTVNMRHNDALITRTGERKGDPLSPIYLSRRQTDRPKQGGGHEGWRVKTQQKYAVVVVQQCINSMLFMSE